MSPQYNMSRMNVEADAPKMSQNKTNAMQATLNVLTTSNITTSDEFYTKLCYNINQIVVALMIVLTINCNGFITGVYTLYTFKLIMLCYTNTCTYSVQIDQ